MTVLLLLLAVLALDCRRERQREIVVYTSVDQPFSEPVFKDFEKTTGVRVHAVYENAEAGNRNVVDRLMASEEPKADVLWAGDPIGAFRVIESGKAEPLDSAGSRQVPSAWRSPEGTWSALAARAGVLLVNRNKAAQGPMPTSVRDLAAPAWRHQTAMASPQHGTTAMIVASWYAKWGDERADAFLAALKENGVRVVPSGAEVGRLVVAGEVTFGLVDTDEAHEATQESTHVAVVYPDQEADGTLLMPTTVVAISGGRNPETARQLIDYLLSAEVEQHMAEQAARIPLRAGIAAPESIRPLSQIRAMQIDYARLAHDAARVLPRVTAWERGLRD
jgi:iron(III) transport system substrate-binding protein